LKTELEVVNRETCLYNPIGYAGMTNYVYIISLPDKDVVSQRDSHN